MFQTVDPRNSGLDYGHVPTGVEVPPLTLAMIVGGALLVTYRAPKPPKWLMGQLQCDLHLFHQEVDLLNAPGSGQARQLFIEFFVLHTGGSHKSPDFSPDPNKSLKPLKFRDSY